MMPFLRKNRSIVALCLALLGPMFVVISVLSLNRLMVNLDSQRQKAPTSFEVKTATNKSVKSKPKPKPKPKPKKSENQLKPNLDSLLAGESFGVESYQWLEKDALGGDLLDDLKDAAMTADTVDDPPQILKTAPLEYPSIARKKGLKGYVTLNILVTPGGRVEKTQVIEAAPTGVFEEVAVASVRQWQFRAGRNKQQNVAVWVEQTIQFSLN